jgi:hypothetical protein
MSNLIRPTNPNQILKLATGLLFVFVLGIVVPNEGFACHKGEPHGPHTCDGPTDPPGTTDPTTLTPCGYDESFMSNTFLEKMEATPRYHPTYSATF